MSLFAYNYMLKKHLLSHASDNRIELWRGQENKTSLCDPSWEGVIWGPVNVTILSGIE